MRPVFYEHTPDRKVILAGVIGVGSIGAPNKLDINLRDVSCRDLIMQH
jgi:hypothetical protein